MYNIGEIVSNVIGWTYFLAWSISFYPQAILNWKRQSVQGLSIDFLWYNVYGFMCYSAKIQKEYQDKNGNKDNLVRANDVFFALHALLLSTITLVQSFIYKVTSTFIKISLVMMILISIGIYFSKFQWIDLIYFLSYIKLLISLIKYVPQAFLNFKRKSTIGWSIHNILLDFTGGVLSNFQLIFDAYLTNNWSGIMGDFVKFGLGFLSITFDLLFMIQHYLLYQDHEDYNPIIGNNNNNKLSFINYLFNRNKNNNPDRTGLLENNDNNVRYV
ncbi:13206_t:CDS:2 [Entrophospora sp. SA101]|nr:13206_t:CDS:2 [Entrophospora sp. SA101]